MKPTISVIIPALNEEKNIEQTIQNVLSAIDNRFDRYELIVFDDCSTDRTENILNRIIAINPLIKVIRNQKTMGLGYNYKKGIELAQYDYISLIHGDNEISYESIVTFFDLVGTSDIIIPYMVNPEIRFLYRQIISKLFTLAMNFLFNLDLKYFNGPVICKKEITESIPVRTNSFAFMTEILVHAVKSRYNYTEVGFYAQKKFGKTKAFQIKNIIGVIKSVITLWLKYILNKL